MPKRNNSNNNNDKYARNRRQNLFLLRLVILRSMFIQYLAGFVRANRTNQSSSVVFFLFRLLPRLIPIRIVLLRSHRTSNANYYLPLFYFDFDSLLLFFGRPKISVTVSRQKTHYVNTRNNHTFFLCVYSIISFGTILYFSSFFFHVFVLVFGNRYSLIR